MQIANLRGQIDALQQRREQLLRSLAETALASNRKEMSGQTSGEFDRLSQSSTDLHARKERIAQELTRIKARWDEVAEYERMVQGELGKLNRARTAGEVLADIKITNCPACDRPIEDGSDNFHHCHLCKRPFEDSHSGQSLSEKRLDFESEQLNEELREIGELIKRLEAERSTRLKDMSIVEDEIARVDSLLRPVRKVAAAILPPEIGIIDQSTGRLEEQIMQLGRVKNALALRADISAKIDAVEQEVKSLESEVKKAQQAINFSQAEDVIADGMNTYLNALNAESPDTWPAEGSVRVRLNERDFRFTIGSGDWTTKLGGTFKAYFMMSYNYALLGLSKDEQYHYPGLVIFDFPPSFEKKREEAGEEVADKTNYMITPFAALINKLGKNSVQLIAAGRSFKGLEDAHRINLTHSWI
jgi:predicted  nucleic acid-binding Zn-ribbon protein